MDEKKKLIRVLEGRQESTPPVWLMRQAGRYLPEYQEVRVKAGGFLDLVYNPHLASEVTIQPVRRFGFDAAILFSDILTVPQVLGTKVRFEDGEGPRLEPVLPENTARLRERNPDISALSPIFETVALTREGLVREGYGSTALIGFAGAPWTVACYMIEGGSSESYEKAQFWAHNHQGNLQELIDVLSDVTAEYLIRQVAAGAEVLQIFDSWAGLLTQAEDFRRWVIAPTKKIIGRVHQVYPDIPVIGFPRAAGPHYKIYIEEAGVQAVGLDQHVTMMKARRYQSLMPVQGNLDPEILRTGEGLEPAVQLILEELGAGPHIFNLGHGIIKETPPEHVARLVSLIRGYSRP